MHGRNSSPQLLKKTCMIILLLIVFFNLDSGVRPLTLQTTNSMENFQRNSTRNSPDPSEHSFSPQRFFVRDSRLALLSSIAFSQASPSYVTHDPISIDGNSDFLTQAANEGWNGTGTESDPILIAGYTITASSGNLIQIHNIDLHFQISNNLLAGDFSYDSKHGISFYNVKYGKIFNNTFQELSSAIDLTESTNNNISCNNFNSEGIYLKNSFNNIIFKNKDCDISFSKSSNNIVSNNILGDGYGLSIAGSVVTDFLQTEVSNNTVDGKKLVFRQNVNEAIIATNSGQIIIVNSTRVEVTGQVHEENDFVGTRIFAVFSSQLYIHDNTIVTSGDGIYLSSSSNNTLSNNIVKKNNNALTLSNSHNNTISKNNISPDNIFGIRLMFSSSYNFISHNNVKGNKPGTGIELFYSPHHNIISNNSINSNSVGLSLAFSAHHNTVVDNTFTGNHLSIDLDYHCYNNSILYNTIVGASTGCGITVFKNATNNLISNNAISNNNWASLRITDCSNNVVSNNSITETTDYGIWVTKASRNTFSNNSISESGKYGIYIESSASTTLIIGNIFSGNNPDGASQAYDDGSNNIFTYNYWSDWVSPDKDMDGIVDSPYLIDGASNNKDLFPRVSPDIPVPVIDNPFISQNTSSISQSTSFDLCAVLFALSALILIYRKRNMKKYN
ncbi:MAG: NosD domain-containing protein [Candidatus Hermodarchaeota archaeon]